MTLTRAQKEVIREMRDRNSPIARWPYDGGSYYFTKTGKPFPIKKNTFKSLINNNCVAFNGTYYTLTTLGKTIEL